MYMHILFVCAIYMSMYMHASLSVCVCERGREDKQEVCSSLKVPLQVMMRSCIRRICASATVRVCVCVCFMFLWFEGLIS